jgi:hypothetical protein
VRCGCWCHGVERWARQRERHRVALVRAARWSLPHMFSWRRRLRPPGRCMVGGRFDGCGAPSRRLQSPTRRLHIPTSPMRGRTRALHDCRCPCRIARPPCRAGRWPRTPDRSSCTPCGHQCNADRAASPSGRRVCKVDRRVSSAHLCVCVLRPGLGKS